MTASQPAAGRAGLGQGPEYRGSCFGFAVHSHLSFVYLRRGRGDPLEVAESDGQPPRPGPLLASWAPTGARPFQMRLFGDDDHYDFWVEDGGWFGIDPAVPRIVAPPTDAVVRREERIWGVPALLCFVARGDVPLHAAAVEVDGGAILIAAPGRFGKTTLASAFVAAGYRLLAEDTSCCRVGDPPLVLPGPAMLRLRRDVQPHMFLPSAPPVARDDERIHLALNDSVRGDGEPVPVRAVVFLRPDPQRCELTRVDPLRVVPDLWAQSFRLPSRAEGARRFCQLVDLASRVPAWDLTRPQGFERLPEVVERIVSLC